ncbi:hypothetical protein GCM10009001_07380 [Virgibacillus siamensis]|uniref:VWFA domain-containing protein n=1 Tax=Virgibacillus siamensis TaxID=480071 RepID=A0ABN1FM56_9BACI
MKKIFTIALLFMILILAACSSSSDEAAKSNENNNEKKAEDQSSKENNSSNEKNKTEKNETEKFMENASNIPDSFAESAEYIGVGKFAEEEYNETFSNHEEVKKVLDNFPKLTKKSPDQKVKKAMKNLFSLFKEDLSKVDVPIKQWESMRFKNPKGKSKKLQLKKNYNVAILLDSSGSMANMQNGKTRMEIAKEAIKQFVENLPEQARISLRVYGHVGTGSKADKKKSCSSIEEVYPLASYKKGKFSKALNQFEPAGWTPMTKAIKELKRNFKKYNSKQNTNIVYVVSDGVETCGGNPVKVVKSLSESNISPVVNIIGFQVNNEGHKQLKEMAKSAHGRYINAKSKADLVSEFEQTVDMAKIWSDWHDNAQETLNKLHDTIQTQLNNWHDKQQKLINREHNNLQTAIGYLDDKKIIDTDVFLQYDDIYTDYFLKMDSEARHKFLKLDEINTDAFLSNIDDVTNRYLDAVD